MGTVRCIVDDTGNVKELHKVVVHQFQIGDVEDPDLYAAQPLWEWQESEPGKFVMEHAIEPPIWQRHNNVLTYNIEYIIVAELESKKLSEFYLKWGKNGNNKIR